MRTHVAAPIKHGPTFAWQKQDMPTGRTDRAPRSPALRMEAEVLVQCRKLALHHGGRPVLDGVSFTIRPGESVGIFGSDAVARAALTGMVCGLVEADAGMVYLVGRPLYQLDPLAVHTMVGYVAHRSVVLPTGTIGDNLEFWARTGGIPNREQRQRTSEVLAKVGLAAHRDNPVAGCSTGALRELSLASALLHRPRLLVMNDPARGLDPRSQARLVATLAGLHAEGTALLHTGHSPDDVPGLCHRMGHLDGGRLTMTGRRATQALSA